MPMPKNSTLAEKVESESVLLNKNQLNKDLQPRKETLQKILQFAAIYKAEKITENRFSDIYLN